MIVGLLCSLGCGRSSFISQRADNFSAYYNTFYNAEKALEESMERFNEARAREPIDRDVFLGLFDSPGRSSARGLSFEDAVKKSADILRKYPDSKWVDDAMLVIGQAWFFTGNYVGAQKKFEEILEIESELHDEARFWLGRTLIGSGQFDEAFTFLQATLEREDLGERWKSMMRLALADLHVQRESWEQAAEELGLGLESARDSDLASRAQFLLGQVYEELGRYEDAVVSYDRVQDYRPFFELSYAAQFNATRVLSDHVDPDQAMVRLRRMVRDDKNYDYRGELGYLHGRILYALGYFDDALDVYDELLYDRTAAGSAVYGHVHYSLGEFNRDIALDFLTAAAHFDTAKTRLPSSRNASSQVGGRERSFAPGAITDEAEQERVFRGFADVMDRISHMDSLLYLGSLSDSAFDAFVLDLREQLAEERKMQRREDARRRAEAGFQGRGGFNGSGGGRTPDGKDIGNAGQDAGFLFHRDQVRMQQAAADFALEWGDRPLAPNWRRIDAIENIGIDDDLGIEGLAEDVEDLDDSLPKVDVSEVPRDDESRSTVLSDRAVARYELANVLFLSMNMPDSAAAWYRMVIEEDADHPVVPRAYYALAEAQRALGDQVGAERLYRTVIELYPASDFSGQVYERLGIESNFEPPPDSLTLAEAAYDATLATWKDGLLASSLDDMIEIALQFPTTSVAPRALMAAGNIYMEWAVRDSLDLFAVLPLSIPDSVLYSTDLFTESPPKSGPRVYDDVVSPDDPPDVTSPSEPLPPEPIPPHLETLYERLLVLYSQDGQVQMASAMQSALTDRKDRLQFVADSLARVDSLALVRQDSLLFAASDSLVVSQTDSLFATVSDSTGAPVNDSLLAVSKDTVSVALDAPPKSETTPFFPGLGLIDWSEGGYTVLVRTESNLNDAISFARSVQFSLPDQAFYVDVYATPIEDGQEFYVGLGLFTMRQQAEVILRSFGNALPADSRIQHIPPAESVEVAERPADEPQEDAEKTSVRRSALVSFVTPNLEDKKSPGLGLIDWSEGGFTILLRTEARHEDAVGFARNFAAALPEGSHPLDVYTAVENNEQIFRVGLGLFEVMQDAQMYLAQYRPMLPEGSRVQRIPKSMKDE